MLPSLMIMINYLSFLLQRIQLRDLLCGTSRENSNKHKRSAAIHFSPLSMLFGVSGRKLRNSELKSGR